MAVKKEQDGRPKETRERARVVEEHLNSPITDPGYWPYDRLAGGLQETITGLDEPDDPLALVPPLWSQRKESDD